MAASIGGRAMDAGCSPQPVRNAAEQGSRPQSKRFIKNFLLYLELLLDSEAIGLPDRFTSFSAAEFMQ